MRQRFVSQGMHEDLDITNYGDSEATFTLALRVDADFAHIFDVKHNTNVQKETIRREGTFSREVLQRCHTLCFRYQRGDFLRRLVVGFSALPEIDEGSWRFPLCLAPRESWHLCINFLTLGDTDRDEPTYNCGRRQTPGLPEHREHRRLETVLQAPRLETDSPLLEQAYAQSVRDFAALQIKGEDISEGESALAAGIPWFMALFGRDSLIAAYQALSFYPMLAKGVVRALARLQGSRVDRLRAEEPGKILHEHRYGAPTELNKLIPDFPCYGTIDATPLFLILLAAVSRGTGDLALARALREPALRALEWMDRFGDRDGDGYLEYHREGEVGRENQGWKDSFDSVRFRDGSLARSPIALCEVQGYAYAARIGMAEVFDLLGEPKRAAELRGKAAALKERFNRDFWLTERGYYAEALDADKRPVDSLTSNAGHLLWSGLADRDKACRVAELLLSPELFSGWGIRTMATTEGGYNPISYHNGSVWPHDNSLIVAGLARYGFVEQAAKAVDGLLAALSQYPDHRLPELFAGYDRAAVPMVVEYPTVSRPQAWASGAPFFLLATMLGLDAQAPSWAEGAAPFLPAGVSRLRVDGLWVDQHRTCIESTGSGTQVIAREVDGPRATTRRRPLLRSS
jgi:glycogen debranching enzyme